MKTQQNDNQAQEQGNDAQEMQKEIMNEVQKEVTKELNGDNAQEQAEQSSKWENQLVTSHYMKGLPDGTQIIIKDALKNYAGKVIKTEKEGQEMFEIRNTYGKIIAVENTLDDVRSTLEKEQENLLKKTQQRVVRKNRKKQVKEKEQTSERGEELKDLRKGKEKGKSQEQSR